MKHRICAQCRLHLHLENGKRAWNREGMQMQNSELPYQMSPETGPAILSTMFQAFGYDRDETHTRSPLNKSRATHNQVYLPKGLGISYPFSP
jgi:hypothetical protein